MTAQPAQRWQFSLKAIIVATAVVAAIAGALRINVIFGISLVWIVAFVAILRLGVRLAWRHPPVPIGWGQAVFYACLWVAPAWVIWSLWMTSLGLHGGRMTYLEESILVLLNLVYFCTCPIVASAAHGSAKLGCWVLPLLVACAILSPTLFQLVRGLFF